MDKLLIIGAGQYGRVTKETAKAMGCFEKISFLDDHVPDALGKISEMERFRVEYACAAVAIGNPEIRMKLLRQLEECCYQIAVLVHPRAYVSPSAQLSKGCIVEPMAVIQTNAVLNPGVILSAGAIVNHDTLICEGCHLDVGSIVKARSVVPAGLKINAGEVYEGTDAGISIEMMKQKIQR